jgi:hypothetical protein
MEATAIGAEELLVDEEEEGRISNDILVACKMDKISGEFRKKTTVSGDGMKNVSVHW